MRRIPGLLFAAALLAAGLPAAGASAASRLTLSEEGSALSAGQTVELLGFENVRIRSSVVDVECPETEAGMTLEVLTNSQSRDEFRVLGFLGVFDGIGLCGSGSRYGNVNLGLSAGPLSLSAKGTAKLPATFDLMFQNELDECHYAKTLKGTSTTSATPAPLAVAFPGQSLHLDRASTNSSGCPKKIELSLSLPVAEGEGARVDAAT